MRCRSCAVCGRRMRREVLARRRCNGAASAAMIPKRSLRKLHPPAPPPTQNGEMVVDYDRNPRDPPLASAATRRKPREDRRLQKHSEEAPCASAAARRKRRRWSTTTRILGALHSQAPAPAQNHERVVDSEQNYEDAPRATAAARRKQREGRRFLHAPACTLDANPACTLDAKCACTLDVAPS